MVICNMPKIKAKLLRKLLQIEKGFQRCIKKSHELGFSIPGPIYTIAITHF